MLDEFGIEAVGEVLDPEYDLAPSATRFAAIAPEVLLSSTYDFRFGLTRRDLLSAEITATSPTSPTFPVRSRTTDQPERNRHLGRRQPDPGPPEDLRSVCLDRSGDVPAPVHDHRSGCRRCFEATVA